MSGASAPQERGAACSYALLGGSLLVPRLLDKIPNAATFGVLCFIGFRGVTRGNEFVERRARKAKPPGLVRTDLRPRCGWVLEYACIMVTVPAGSASYYTQCALIGLIRVARDV